MAKKVGILMLCYVLMLVFFNMQASSIEILASQLQPQCNHQMYGITQGSLRPQECARRRTARWSKKSYKKPCKFFCQKCCAKCLCVPSGTYGNKQVCPCYNNWKTKSGGPKCP